MGNVMGILKGGTSGQVRAGTRDRNQELVECHAHNY